MAAKSSEVRPFGAIRLHRKKGISLHRICFDHFAADGLAVGIVNYSQPHRRFAHPPARSVATALAGACSSQMAEESADLGSRSFLCHSAGPRSLQHKPPPRRRILPSLRRISYIFTLSADSLPSASMVSYIRCHTRNSSQCPSPRCISRT